MSEVEFQSVTKSFGSKIIIRDFSLKIAAGEFLAVVGPSGCGKSTLLRLLAGLENPDRGHISIAGKTVDDLDPSARGVSMVFQSYALYPHMTVEDNLRFPLRMAKMDSREMAERVRETAAMLDLTDLLERKPSQLSGGQKQRVAMGRAIIKRPAVLLFDEPLSNLDAQLRNRVRSEIAHLHRKIKSTVLYVTHDQVEAMTLADRITVLNQGAIEQVDPPLVVYRRPRTRFVASFIGTPPMNLVPSAAFSAIHTLNGSETIGFRPESTYLNPLRLSSGLSERSQGQLKIGEGQIELVEPLGSLTHLHIRFSDLTLIATVDGSGPPEELPKISDRTEIWVEKSALFYFDKEGLRI